MLTAGGAGLVKGPEACLTCPKAVKNYFCRRLRSSSTTDPICCISFLQAVMSALSAVPGNVKMGDGSGNSVGTSDSECEL